jgi:hypothetical protein
MITHTPSVSLSQIVWYRRLKELTVRIARVTAGVETI